MTKPRRPQAPSTHRYPRTARLSTSLQEVIADELTRIDDERLALVTITAIDVDPEMNRAIVFFDSLMGDEADAHILVALADHRVRIQGSIRAAERIERILHDKATLPERPPSPSDDTDNDTDNDSDSDADTHTGDTLTGDNARDGE